MSDLLLRKQAQNFLERVFGELERNHVALEPHWHIDHLCFRTATQNDYLSTKKQFESISKLLIESEVNGRLISTYKLETPLTFDNWEIDLIEVPAPKHGKIVANGFEHIEVVCDLAFGEIKSLYRQSRFDESGLAKNFNQDLEMCFDGLAVKFHHVSLESVINIEANKSVFSALKSSQILDYLKPFSPVLAGAFPLNINVSGSDIDILISGIDLNLMKKILTEKLENFPNFQCTEIFVRGERTLLCSFSHQSIDFEIFGQQTPSIKQRGYLHFLVEERLLKIGRTPFAKKVMEGRRQGLKTEPAFAKALELTGDPYEELLILQRKSNQELKALIQSH